VTFVCSPNNPTGTLEDPATIAAVADLAPGVVVVDEAYGQFADRSALELVGDDRPIVVTRTFSKTWSMAAARLGYLIGPTWLVAELEKVVLPYHLDAAKQVAGRVALRFGSEMEERVAALVAERRRLVDRLGRLPVQQWRSDANFVLFRPLDRPGARCGRGCSTAPCSSATARRGPVSTGASGSPSARWPRTTPSSPPSPRCSSHERPGADRMSERSERGPSGPAAGQERTA
jgi:histidinol-phosphate/aromatic aminotransferase/cobyric acid decarboxylase-like protein